MIVILALKIFGVASSSCVFPASRLWHFLLPHYGYAVAALFSFCLLIVNLKKGENACLLMWIWIDVYDTQILQSRQLVHVVLYMMLHFFFFYVQDMCHFNIHGMSMLYLCRIWISQINILYYDSTMPIVTSSDNFGIPCWNDLTVFHMTSVLMLV